MIGFDDTMCVPNIQQQGGVQRSNILENLSVRSEAWLNYRSHALAFTTSKQDLLEKL